LGDKLGVLVSHPFFLRVLFFREPHHPDTWIAQGLEHDLAAFGKDVEQAKRAFEHTVSGYIMLANRNGQEPFEKLRPAPRMFWDIWTKETAQRALTGEPILALPGYMLTAVTDERLQATH
jgi:hypothetical protein